MFKVSKLVKNVSVVVASLALIAPLASVNGTSASAHHVRKHARIVRVMKRNNKRSHKRAVKHMRVGSVNSYNRKVNVALNKEPKNGAYAAGFNDALNAKVNHKLVHNHNYEKGYLQIIALDNYTDPTGKNVPKRLSNGALKGAKVYYNDCILK